MEQERGQASDERTDEGESDGGGGEAGDDNVELGEDTLESNATVVSAHILPVHGAPYPLWLYARGRVVSMWRKEHSHNVKVLALLQAETAQKTRARATEQAVEETALVNGSGVSVGAVVREETDNLLEELGDDGETTGDVLFVGRVLVDDVALLSLYVSRRPLR